MNKSQKSELLVFILLTGGVITLSLLAPQLPYEILKAYLKEKEFRRKKLQNNIYYLVKQGLIEKEKVNEKYTLKLTDRGFLQAEYFQSISEPIETENSWSNHWYLAIFDIPIKKNAVRHQISQILKEIGCIQIQKSIYLSPYPFREKLLIITKYHRIESCFYYFKIPDQPVFANFKEDFNL